MPRNCSPRRVALVGMQELPEPDFDEAPLLAALRDAGFDAQVLHWDSDEPAHDPAHFDVCVLRATWDYHKRADRFTAWLRRAASESVLCNPLATVLWNMHKRYLLQLNQAGVPIIPTILIRHGDGESCGTALRQSGWSDVVIKPAISAASWNTRRFRNDASAGAESFLVEQVAERDTLIQPYLSEVESGGEVSIVWVDGQVTHAIRKAPRFEGGEERVEPCAIESRHISIAHRALRAAQQDAMYARIDVVERADGSTVLSELELIEPSLHFNRSPIAVRRFVNAIAQLEHQPTARHQG